MGGRTSIRTTRTIPRPCQGTPAHRKCSGTIDTSTPHPRLVNLIVSYSHNLEYLKGDVCKCIELFNFVLPFLLRGIYNHVHIHSPSTLLAHARPLLKGIVLTSSWRNICNINVLYVLYLSMTYLDRGKEKYIICQVPLSAR